MEPIILPRVHLKQNCFAFFHKIFLFALLYLISLSLIKMLSSIPLSVCDIFLVKGLFPKPEVGGQYSKTLGKLSIHI